MSIRMKFLLASATFAIATPAIANPQGRVLLREGTYQCSLDPDKQMVAGKVAAHSNPNSQFRVALFAEDGVISGAITAVPLDGYPKNITALPLVKMIPVPPPASQDGSNLSVRNGFIFHAKAELASGSALSFVFSYRSSQEGPLEKFGARLWLDKSVTETFCSFFSTKEELQ